MGFFSFFSKDKKEVLDKGLSKSKESVLGKITRAIAGKSKVDDEVLDNLEEALITSDVGIDTTLKIIKRIEERVARDKYVTTNELNGILKDEIAALLTENESTNTEGFSIPDDAKRPYVAVLDADKKEKRVYIKITLSTGVDAAVVAADGYTLNEGDVLRYIAESGLISSLF